MVSSQLRFSPTRSLTPTQIHIFHPVSLRSCFLTLRDRPFAFAGLWDRWEEPSGPVETCCILTTEANDLVRPAHDRMPVMLERPYFEQWLDPAEQDADALAWMLRLCQSFRSSVGRAARRITLFGSCSLRR